VADDGRRSGTIVLRRTMGRGAGAAELQQAFALGIAVEGLVKSVNKGGFDVQIGGVRAFCPGSQIDVRRNDAETYVGQRLRFKVTKLEGGGRNVVVSRRDVLEEEARERAAVTWAKLEVGAVVTGTVVSLRDFGAFVDLGGVEGMIHVSELGYARAQHPSEVLEVGQRVEAQVLKIERDASGRSRIALSLRALAADPWLEVPARFPVGTDLRGVVRRLEPFGAFVEIAPGVEGLVHVSEMALDRRLSHSRQAAEVGQEIDVTVVSLDPEKRRIGLSMTARAREAHAREQASEARETEALLARSNAEGGSLGTLGDLLRSPQRKGRGP
jgi:small subunit ribosomal protein S1